MSRLLRLLSLGMLTLLVAGSASATTLLQEDFNDGVADGFTPLSGDWYVEGGSYHCLVEGTNLAYSTFAGDSSWTDYDFRGRVRVDGERRRRRRNERAGDAACVRQLQRRVAPAQVVENGRDVVVVEIVVPKGVPRGLLKGELQVELDHANAPQHKVLFNAFVR